MNLYDPKENWWFDADKEFLDKWECPKHPFGRMTWRATGILNFQKGTCSICNLDEVHDCYQRRDED